MSITEKHNYSQFTRREHIPSKIIPGKKTFRDIFICPICREEHSDIPNKVKVTCECGTEYYRTGNLVEITVRKA